MNIIRRYICFAATLILVMLCCTGCAYNIDKAEVNDEHTVFDPFYSAEEKAADTVMNTMCDALNTGNPDMIVGLFSDNIFAGDKKLRDQACAVIDAFEGGTAVCWDVGASSSGQTIIAGKTNAYIEMPFVICSGDDYYWCRIYYVYENDEDADDVGLKWLKFYTIDEYYLLLNADGEYSADSDSGIYVYADERAGVPLRCIQNIPYVYNESSYIDSEEAAAFLNASNSFDDFQQKFGSQNGNRGSRFVYGLMSEDGDPRYLVIFVDEETGLIYDAAIVNDREWLEALEVYDEKE